MAKSVNNPIADVAAHVVAGDPELRRRVGKLVKRLIAEAEHTLDFGTPTDRAALMKAVVPTMLRSIQSAEGDAGDAARAAAYARIMEQMRGGDSADVEDTA